MYMCKLCMYSSHGCFVFADGIHHGGIIMTAISFAPLSSKCGDPAIRDAERPRRLEGSSASARKHGAARFLLRFHPTILAAVAVFLINMLILHEHRPITGRDPLRRVRRRSRCREPSIGDGNFRRTSTSSRVFRGLRPRVIRNTCDQESIRPCTHNAHAHTHTHKWIHPSGVIPSRRRENITVLSIAKCSIIRSMRLQRNVNLFPSASPPTTISIPIYLCSMLYLHLIKSNFIIKKILDHLRFFCIFS